MLITPCVARGNRQYPERTMNPEGVQRMRWALQHIQLASGQSLVLEKLYSNIYWPV